MRICSLLPSATEIVAELGLVESLVAVSEECDWPPEVRDLPSVTASRVDTTRLSSFEIDRAVRAAVGEGRPLYAIDREQLEALEPDLILTQDLCAVCAVSSDTVDELRATDAEVVALDAHTLADIEERILSLADLLGVTARGRAVVGEMEAKIAAVHERVRKAAPRPVFVAEWLDPPYAAGHWIPEMIAVAGGRDVLGRAGAPSYPTSWENVREQRPELVIAAPCGFDHTRATREAAHLPPLACRAVAVDSNAYYARPAPRVADGVAQLAFLIHPELMPDPGLPYVQLAAGPVRPMASRTSSDGAKGHSVPRRLRHRDTSGSRSLRLGLLHLAPEAGAVEQNRALIEKATTVAADMGAAWVVSGELVVPGYRFHSLIGTEWITSQPGRWMRRFAELSASLGVVSIVSHPERDDGSGRLFNTLFIINREGHIVGRHQKLHPTPGAEDWSSPGKPGVPIAVDGINVGLLICADAYTPEPALRLRELGAELLISAAAWWPGDYGPNGEWEARTLDTGLPMIVCNRTGVDGDSQLIEAESAVIDKGHTLTSLRSPDSAIFVIDCQVNGGGIVDCAVADTAYLSNG